MNYQFKTLLCTGVGNTIQGGADIWVNHFLKEVWPLLPEKKTWRLLVDSKKPLDFETNSLPKGLQYHFHFDDVEKTKKWLEESVVIHSLHSHYHKRDHIWHYEDKFGTIFVHAYPPEMNEIITKNNELNRLQHTTKVDVNFFDDYLVTFKKRVWIGNNKSKILEKFPFETYEFPNFYEFKHNRPLTTHVTNGKVGFASRIESRKCFHWMDGIEGYALTSKRDIQNLKDTSHYTFRKTQIYQWSPNIHHQFMTKNWGIFHGAYFKEPFGYSIFQAVDYGKLPILNKDWAVELDYKYRASTKNEFNKCIKQILKDSYKTQEFEFNKLKNYMKQFDNKNQWIEQVKSIVL